jgi:hypothetical protein
MGNPLPPAALDRERDCRQVKPSDAALAAEHQRKIATGWLYLVDITSDQALRTSYEQIARHHLLLADAEEKRGSPSSRGPD